MLLIPGILASRKTGFSPSDLAGLTAWYDASDTATISLSGSSVTQWDDKSTNNYDLVQSTAASQPTSGVSTLNGKNVITFDGADFLINTNKSNWKFLHDGTDYIFAAVVKVTTSANPNNFYSIFDNNQGGSANIGVSIFYDDRASVPRNEALLHVVAKGVGGQFVVNNVSANGYFPPDAYEALTLLADPDNGIAANRSIFKVEANTENNNSLTASPSSANATYDFHVGILSDGVTGGITGGIAELIFVSGVDATAGNRDLLLTYLKDKWAV